jgi:hypothetical protein
MRDRAAPSIAVPPPTIGGQRVFNNGDELSPIGDSCEEPVKRQDDGARRRLL